MKITKEQVLHVAALARLKLSPQEVEMFIAQMGDIIEFADKLNDLDVENVKPTAQALEIQNVFRQDECRESYPREKILSNAPAQSDGCYIVPKIVD